MNENYKKEVEIVKNVIKSVITYAKVGFSRSPRKGGSSLDVFKFQGTVSEEQLNELVTKVKETLGEESGWSMFRGKRSTETVGLQKMSVVG